MKEAGLALCFFVLLLLAGCAKNRSLIVLLPDSSGEVGTIYIRTDQSTVIVDKAYNAVAAIRDKDLQAPRPMKKEEIETRFEKALAIEPQQQFRVKKWIVYCHHDSTELISDSRNDFPKMISNLLMEPPVEIYVAGHTDRVGTEKYNRELSKRRALAVKQELVANGVNPSIITVCFLGDSTPQVIESGKLQEPKNRRVELVMKYSIEE
jgi:outer membrane protein OmpA-like peptidoglycan-associated protein